MINIIIPSTSFFFFFFVPYLSVVVVQSEIPLRSLWGIEICSKALCAEGFLWDYGHCCFRGWLSCNDGALMLHYTGLAVLALIPGNTWPVSISVYGSRTLPTPVVSTFIWLC